MVRGTLRAGQTVETPDSQPPAGATGAPTSSARVSPPPSSTEPLDPAGVKALAVGGVLALVIYSIPLTRFILNYLVILVHELGHTVVAWLFGYPAIPAFDFVYGGGVSFHQGRQYLLLAVVWAALGGGIYLVRSRPGLRNLLIGVTAVHVVFAVTPLHEALQILMGHGSELVFAGIFLYRAATGAACKLPVERPLYAMVGWFTEISVLLFCHRLLTDPVSRLDYGEAKGGGHWMDLSRLAEDYFHTGLRPMAGLLLVLGLLPPVLALLYARHRHRLTDAAARLARTV
jgi:hypothetical protein